MPKTWILATSALAVGALTLLRWWWSRQSGDATLAASQTVSPEWLSNARGQRDETW